MYGLITRYFFSHGPEDGFDGKAAQVPMAGGEQGELSREPLLDDWII
jgi:hypothetical protein